MKKLQLIISLFSLCSILAGQEPESVRYHTIVHDLKGNIMSSRQVSLRLSIISGIGDETIYSENHYTKTNEAGFVSLELGNGTGKTGSFSNIDWRADDYYLRVEIDTAGGTAFANIGTTQILVIPYAGQPLGSKNSPGEVISDKLFIRRKFAGKFVDFRQTGPNEGNGPNIIWIKTSMESVYGKLSAYGKKCKFSPGDNLYIKRSYYNPGGVSGYWVYRVENDSAVYYRLTDFQHDRKIPVETWFK